MSNGSGDKYNSTLIGCRVLMKAHTSRQAIIDKQQPKLIVMLIHFQLYQYVWLWLLKSSVLVELMFAHHADEIFGNFTV